MTEENKEIDIQILKKKLYSVSDTKNDPFLKLNKDFLSSSLKRKVTRKQNRMSKKYQGKSGVGTKALETESLNAYDVLQVVPPPYNLEALAKLFEKNPTHNAAVTAKAVNILGLGWDIIDSRFTRLKIEQLQRRGSKKELDEFVENLEIERLRLHRNIDNLNIEEEFGEIMVKIWKDVESTGNGYLEIGRMVNGKIGYIGHVPAFTLRVRSQRDGYIQVSANRYVFFRNYGEQETPDPLENDANPNELIHFKKYSPHSTYYGVPDIISALSAVMGDHLSKEYNLDYFENKAVPRYVFITKGAQLSEESENKLTEYFTKELKGKHHGTLYIPLPPATQGDVDAKFEQIENRPQEQSFIDYIQDSRLEILMAHRVPPPKAGVYDRANLAVARDADKTFKEQVCAPEQTRVEKRINMLFSEFTSKFLIKFRQADIIDSDVKSRMYDRYLRTRVLKPNEVRRELGWPAAPEGDEFLPPPGSNSGGRPSQTSEGTKPKTRSPKDQVGDRAERGELQGTPEEEDKP